MFSADMLTGSTILVTGGGTGLGRAMAERFASVGAKVGVSGRRVGPLEETVAAIRAAGGIPELGPITGLVNNAAGNFLAPSEDLSANAFNSVVQIVLYGAFHVTQACGKRWIERQSGGRVLSILTTYAWMGSPFVLPSAMAKAGVLAMTRSLAVEWGCYGIRFNAIAPGPFPTEGAFSRLMMDTGMEEEGKKHNPTGRFGDPPELGDLAAFLMSPMAAYINGDVVTIDGGEWLRIGQEFGGMTGFDRDAVKAMLSSMKPSKG